MFNPEQRVEKIAVCFKQFREASTFMGQGGAAFMVNPRKVLQIILIMHSNVY